MPDEEVVGAEYTLVEVCCPICGVGEGTPLVPSAKRDEVGKTFFVDERIMLCVCENCGTVYENPQIKLEGLTPYAEKNYYTAANTAWGHDNIQHVWTFYNWHALKDALPWDDFTAVMDVGAAGAWSNAMRERAPNVREAVLVEPSPKGVFNCEVRYPRVRAELGIFEEYEDDPDKFDLITFFNSFYSIADPRAALRKVHRLLKPGGYLVLCFSYVGMNLEFWNVGEPYVHMSHVVRGVPLIYFSENTYRKLCDISGFEIVNDIVFEIPDGDKYKLAGRQLNFVVAKSVRPPLDKVNPACLRDPDEVDRGRRFYTKYCEIVTEKSIRLFLDQNQAGGWTVVHDGDGFYGRWVAEKFAEQGVTVIVVDGSTVPVAMLPDKVGDEEGHTVFLAGDWSENGRAATAAFKAAKVIDCSPSDGYKGYGNWLRNPGGDIVITRSFCPCHSLGDAIFPFDKRPSINRRDIPMEVFGIVEREPFLLPSSVDDIPFFAAQAATLALAMPPEERRAYLQPFHEMASNGVASGSIMSMSAYPLPAEPVIPSLDELVSAKRVSAIRPVIQWASLLAPTEFLSDAVAQLSRIHAGS